jgi:altronate hydrolase
MSKCMIIMHPKDNVGVVLEGVSPGDTCCSGPVELKSLEVIEFGHKIALQDIAQGENIIKYGEKIGYALVDIKKGQWIHRHNIESERGK